MKIFIYTGVAFYKAGGTLKISLIFLTASILTPFLDKMQQYLIPNLDSLAIFIILMGLDVISGLYKHSGIWSKEAKNNLNKDDFFFKLIKKMFVSAVWLILVNAVEQYAKKNQTASEYLQMFGTSVLISWLVWSIAENLAATNGGTFPPVGLMKRLRLAKDTGDLSELNKKEDNGTN
ncbi:hypothetical protein [Flavobacterium phage FPSV-S1]|nr:hypothetical protein [Flavobacterium phage FPSV-S1]QCW20497.1 hypothetical protein [Flavobacterium phage FPSV-S8]